MNALLLTVFVSLVLLAYGLVQFVAAWLRGEHEHADRLALLPLEDAPVVAVAASSSAPIPDAVADGGETP